MNYGYTPTSKGWKENKKEELAKRLRVLVSKYQDTTCSVNNPYVEVDALYPGVRIRKITYLREERVDQLVAEAENIYDEVMETKPTKEAIEWRNKVLARQNIVEEK